MCSTGSNSSAFDIPFKQLSAFNVSKVPVLKTGTLSATIPVTVGSFGFTALILSDNLFSGRAPTILIDIDISTIRSVLGNFFNALNSLGNFINRQMNTQMPIIHRTFNDLLQVSASQQNSWGTLFDFASTLNRYPANGHVSPKQLASDMLTDFKARLANTPLSKTMFVAAGVNNVTQQFSINFTIDATLTYFLSPNFTDTFSTFNIPVGFDVSVNISLAVQVRCPLGFGLSCVVPSSSLMCPLCLTSSSGRFRASM